MSNGYPVCTGRIRAATRDGPGAVIDWRTHAPSFARSCRDAMVPPVHDERETEAAGAPGEPRRSSIYPVGPRHKIETWVKSSRGTGHNPAGRCRTPRLLDGAAPYQTDDWPIHVGRRSVTIEKDENASIDGVAQFVGHFINERVRYTKRYLAVGVAMVGLPGRPQVRQKAAGSLRQR